MLTDIALLVGLLVLGCAGWVLWARGERTRERMLSLVIAVLALLLVGDVVRSEIVARRAAWQAECAAVWGSFQIRKAADTSAEDIREQEAIQELKFSFEEEMQGKFSDAEALSTTQAIMGNGRAARATVAQAKAELDKRVVFYQSKGRQEQAQFAAEKKALKDRYSSEERGLRRRYGPPPK